MRNGKGVYHFGEKNKIEGIWKNSLPHGEGILTYDNKIIEGEFRYGKLVKGENKQEEISSPKKSKKSKKSLDTNKHKHHRHHSHSHNHDSKNKKKKSKNKHSEDNLKNKSDINEKDKDADSNNTKEKSPVEIDCLPGICVKKKK